MIKIVSISLKKKKKTTLFGVGVRGRMGKDKKKVICIKNVIE